MHIIFKSVMTLFTKHYPVADPEIFQDPLPFPLIPSLYHLPLEVGPP